MNEWNLVEIMLIVLGQVCESFIYVFETRIDTDLKLFREETSYLHHFLLDSNGEKLPNGKSYSYKMELELKYGF